MGGGTDLVVQINNVRSLLEKSKGSLSAALGKLMPVEYFMRVAMTTVQRNPALLECDRQSLLAALIECSQLGLAPDNILGHAYLVPYKVRGVLRVQLIPGYKGLIELARRSEKVMAVYARLVYEKEFFNLCYGIDQVLEHVPLPPSERGEKTIGVYAVGELVGNVKVFEFLWMEEVMEIKKSSASAGSDYSPWKNHEGEMIKKTAIRRLAKVLPQCPQLQKAAAIDTLGDLGLSQREVFESDGDIIEAESAAVADKTAKKATNLKDRLKEAGPGATVCESPAPPLVPAQKPTDAERREALLASIESGREILLELSPTGNDTISGIERDLKIKGLETATLDQLDKLGKRISAIVGQLQPKN